jgi:hypothetical protein
MPLLNESINGMRIDLRNSTADILQMKDLVVTLASSFVKNTDEMSGQFRDLRNDIGHGLTDMGVSLTRGAGASTTGVVATEGSTSEGSTPAEVSTTSSGVIATGSTGEEASPDPGSEQTTTPVPVYRMSRGVVTIAEAYAEYMDGFFPRPSVKSLEERYGNQWRLGNTETQFYSRRLPLYRVFKKLVVEKKWGKDDFIPRLFEFSK